METIIKNGGITLKITDNSKNFFKIFDFTERKSLNSVGKFCKGKMDYYVAVKSGRLKSNNRYKVTLFNNLELYNETPYARYQEFGREKQPYTFTPFMRPSVYNHLAEIEQIAGSDFVNGLRDF